MKPRLFRKASLGVLATVLAACGGEAVAQTAGIDIDALFERSASAMGLEGDTRFAISATGWEACLGQPWAVRDGWAPWSLTDYRRVLDIEQGVSRQTALRQPGRNPDRLGGCGAQPGAAPGRQQSGLTAASPWEQQLQLWLTPPGFLALARRQQAVVRSDGDGWTAEAVVTVDGIRYRLIGRFDEQHLLREINTWIDNSVFGDMTFDAEFRAYRDFGDLRYPSVVEQKQGGFTTLYLDVSAVEANPADSAMPESGSRRARTGDPAGGPRYVQVENGVFVMLGSYQSVAVEFSDFIVVVDGLQSDTRARELIELAREAIPGKPIRYVVSTHAHFDHASGLRNFTAAGATILTHVSNIGFFEEALNTPRTLDGDGDDNVPQIRLQGVGDYFRLDDDAGQVLELHKLNGSLHADDMLIAFLPASGTVIEADLLQPWINPVFAGNHDGAHPYLVYLAAELERLQLDYRQFVPIHQPNPAPLMFRDDLMEAIR